MLLMFGQYFSVYYIPLSSPFMPFRVPPVGRLQGRRSYDPMARIVPTILLHFLRPWRSDGGRYDSRDGGVRAASGTAAENEVRNQSREVWGGGDKLDYLPLSSAILNMYGNLEQLF